MAKKTIIGEDGKEYIVKEKKPFYKRWWFITLVAFIVIGALFGDRSTNEVANQTTSGEQAEQQTVSEEAPSTEETASVEEPTEEVAKIPKEFENALKKAGIYSSTMHMSKKAIYDQLTSEYGENFPAEAAQYAVDNLEADYNFNALEKAKVYQNEMAMSKEAIREQLVSEYGEKFTKEQADYAIKNLE